MLKAYDFTERKQNIKLHEKRLLDIEKKIAIQYVIDHPTKIKAGKCPICGENCSKYIFERWDVEYRLCTKCGTIFTSVDRETLEGYLSLQELKDFRNTERYQCEEEEYRGLAWDEFIDWLSFRTYRYMGTNENFRIIDIGNKYAGLSYRLKKATLCKHYRNIPSISDFDTEVKEKADVILYLNQIKHELEPVQSILKIREYLNDNGIIVLSSRLGSGFDVLTLKGGTDSIFPYEHITLPSRKGLEVLLNTAGFELLEITTPGNQDVDAVFDNRERVGSDDYFVRTLIEYADEQTKVDFQQFLQKSCLSSFAQVIARKL